MCGGGAVVGVTNRSNWSQEGVIPFPPEKASSIWVPPKPLSGSKTASKKEPLPEQKSQLGEDDVGEPGMFSGNRISWSRGCWKRGMKPKCMSRDECVHVHKCVSVCGLGVGDGVTQR